MAPRKAPAPPAGDALAAYVDAACAQHGIALAPDERARVVAQYARLAALAAPLVECPLPADVDPAPVFRP
jgi:hypothetical protein